MHGLEWNCRQANFPGGGSFLFLGKIWSCPAPECKEHLVDSIRPIQKVAAAAVLFCALLTPGCKPGAPEPVSTAPLVRTLVVESGQTDSFRRFPGEVSALQTSEMSFDVPGRLIERPATQGLVVAAGELLARLDAENFETRLSSATARLNNAREELERRKQLHRRGVIAVSELEQFQTQFEVAEAEQREAQRALDDTRLVAPFDGRVARTLVNNFQNVQAKQPVLVFQNISELEVDIEVPERLMSLAGQGVTAESARDLLEGRVEFSAIPGQTFPLQLKSFSTEATPAARTFRVTFTLHPPPGSNVLPGMTCTVLLRRTGGEQAQQEPGLFEVPVQSVSTTEGGSAVWKVSPGDSTVRRVPVELLEPVGQSLRIRSNGLNSGDEIVVSGVRFLSEGAQITRMNEAAN